MYRRILIPNRANCALRLIRACHSMGIAAYLAAARDEPSSSQAFAEADGIVFTGAGRDAYMSASAVLEAARHCACEAILPGWGFLSEDFRFARRARLAGIHFIGPSEPHLQIFGDKLRTLEVLSPALNRFADESRRTGGCGCGMAGRSAQRYLACDARDFEAAVLGIPAPLMLKYRYGGGGAGLSIHNTHEDLIAATSALGRATGNYYVEPAVSDGRHLEFQFMGDGRGRVDCWGARNCTPQSHFRKFCESSIDLSERDDLASLSSAFGSILASMRYLGWGTVECLIDGSGTPHLLELNARLQVEHGVTECATGCDMVTSAIGLACTGRMPQFVPKIPVRNAVEFRLYALSAGVLSRCDLVMPSIPDVEIRVDSAAAPGLYISAAYDGLLARVIVSSHKHDAQMLLDIMKRVVAGVDISGVGTNIDDLMSLESIPEI